MIWVCSCAMWCVLHCVLPHTANATCLIYFSQLPRPDFVTFSCSFKAMAAMPDELARILARRTEKRRFVSGDISNPVRVLRMPERDFIFMHQSNWHNERVFVFRSKDKFSKLKESLYTNPPMLSEDKEYRNGCRILFTDGEVRFGYMMSTAESETSDFCMKAYILGKLEEYNKNMNVFACSEDTAAFLCACSIPVCKTDPPTISFSNTVGRVDITVLPLGDGSDGVQVQIRKNGS